MSALDTDMHGTRGCYQEGCRCDSCRASNAEYVRANRRRGSRKLHVQQPSGWTVRGAGLHPTKVQDTTDWPNPICTDCDRVVLVTMRGLCLACQPAGVSARELDAHRSRTLTSIEAGRTV